MGDKYSQRSSKDFSQNTFDLMCSHRLRDSYALLGMVHVLPFVNDLLDTQRPPNIIFTGNTTPNYFSEGTTHAQARTTTHNLFDFLECVPHNITTSCMLLMRA